MKDLIEKILRFFKIDRSLHRAPLSTQGSKLSLFSLYMQWLPRYGQIFKIAVFFVHETWNLKKGPEVAYGPSFYPSWSKLSSFSLYGEPFSRQRNFKS